jgi:CheY-like chemotaxis protein
MEKEVAVAIVKIIPSICWVVLTGVIIYIFRNVIKSDLIPRMSNFKALGVEASFVKKELDRIAVDEFAGTDENRSQVARRSERIKFLLKDSSILIVNDVPLEMAHVINIFEKLNIKVSISTSTEDALSCLSSSHFDLVISDMRRGSKVDAGIELLNKLRSMNIDKPVIFTVGKYEPQRGVPPYSFGITNRVDELMNLVFDAIERRKG